jgi:TolA-binding protein
LFRTGKYAQSIQAYKTMLAKYPDSAQAPLAYLRIAHAAFNSRDDAAALREATALIDRFPDSKESGDALDIMEAVFDRAPAIKFEPILANIVSSHPRTHVAAEAQFRLARRLYERKKYDRAAAEFQRFSVDYTEAPQLPRAQFMMAESLLQVGEFSSAIAAYQRFLNNFPRSPDTPLALFHLASAHYKLKEYEPAAVNYQRLEEEYPDSEMVKPALFNMALSLKTLGKFDQAQDAYLKYARLVGIGDPSAVSALWEVFAIQKDNNNYDGALSTLEQIKSSLKPGAEGAIEVVYRTGEVYSAMGRADDAVAAYKRLKAMRPATNTMRLAGMIKLAELCEKTEPAAAIAAYEDLARNSTNRKVVQAARERIAALNGKYPMTTAPRRRHRKPKAAAQEETNSEEDTGVQQEPADAATPAPPAAPTKSKTTQGGQ